MKESDKEILKRVRKLKVIAIQSQKYSMAAKLRDIEKELLEEEENPIVLKFRTVEELNDRLEYLYKYDKEAYEFFVKTLEKNNNDE